MFGAIAGGIASALAGGALSKLFGGGQKAASGGVQGVVLATDNNTVGMGDAGIKSAIQGSNVPNPDEAVPSFVSGAMAKAGQGLLEGTLQAGTSAVSDKLLDLVGLGGKSAADKGKDTRDYLAAAFLELPILMLVLNLPFKALMFLTLMRPSLVLFLVLWLKLVKDFLKVRCRLALLPFLISCLIWLDLVASLPLIKERILVIILLLHFLSLMLGSVLVLMLPLLVWLTPDLRIKKSLLKCNWTIRKRLPRCKMRLKKRLLAFSRRLHARIRKTRYMHKMRCLLINRRSLLLALRLLWKTPIFPSNSRFPRLCAKCLLKLKRLVSILPMTKSKK